MFDESKELNKIISYKNADYVNFHLLLSPVIFKYTHRNNL